MSKSLSAMVMGYNEAPTLPIVIDELDQILQRHCEDYEIVIIDDGSRDGMGAVADGLAETYEHCRVVHHALNQGLGGVYRTAFREGRKDVLYFLAADGQSDPEVVVPLFLDLLADHHVVLGAPRKRKDPLLSRLFTLGERIVFGVMFPGVPKIGGPCMVRRELLERIPLVCMEDQSRGWIVLWELVVRAKRAGYRIAACDIVRRPRKYGKTKGNTWANALLMLKSAFRLKWIILSKAEPEKDRV